MRTAFRPVSCLLFVFFVTLSLGWTSIRADGDVVQGEPVPDGRGSWSIVEDGDGDLEADGRALPGAALAESLKQIAKLFEGTKGWNPPRGVQIEARTRPVDLGSRRSADVPPAARLDLQIIALVRNEEGIVPGHGRECSLAIVANDLDAAIGRENRMEDGYADEAGCAFYLAPELMTTVQGFRRYRTGQLVIARSGREPFVPVSRADFLKAAIRRAESQIAENAAGRKEMEAFRPSDAYEAMAAERRKSFEETYATLKAFSPAQAEEFKASFEKMEKELPEQFKEQEAQLKAALAQDPMGDALRRRIVALRKELDALGPAEASRQAWWAGSPENLETSGLVAPKSEEARPLVRPNLAYFESGAARESMQLLVVESGLPTEEEELAALEESGEEEDFLAFKRLRLFLDVDWKAVAKLLGR